MKGMIMACAVLAAACARADRMLGRESAARLFAASNLVGRVERLEATALTAESLSPATAYVADGLTTVGTRPFATTTVRASSAMGEDEERTAELVPASSRNYDVFLPDDALTRTMLPIAVRVDVAGAETYLSTNLIEELPAFVHVREPAPGIVTVRVEGVR